MQLSPVEGYLLQPRDRSSKRGVFLWLIFSLIFAGLLTSFALKIAFSDRYVIQNDARQYSFFFQQLKDPTLFQGDLIARYYDSVIPFGFQVFYKGAVFLGIDPFFLNKVLPLILVLITTTYCFAVTLEILPVPLAGFLASALLNQNLWTKEDLSSGTPRSFVYPLFLPFLYYFIRRSWIPCVLLAFLQALFFPPAALISICMLGFQLWKSPQPKKRALVVLIAAICLAALVLVPYSQKSSEFGPVVTREEASHMAAFQAEGTQPFFVSNPWNFWLFGWHSGILPYGMRPPLIWAGLLLPLLWIWRPQFNSVRALAEVLVASLLMFAVAHMFLFHLYNPGRYTQHTLPVIMAVSAGISLTLLLQYLFQKDRRIAWASILLGCIVLIVQFQKTVAHGHGFQIYVKGTVPELYSFLISQPADTLVASFSAEADNLPAFTGRATLLGREYALPYHSGYFRQIEQRGNDWIRAQYSRDLSETREIIRKYEVDFILLDRIGFEYKYFDAIPWIRIFQPAAHQAEAQIANGVKPALTGMLTSCAAFQNDRLVLLNAECVLKMQAK